MYMILFCFWMLTSKRRSEFAAVLTFSFKEHGARCSSVVRAFDPSCWAHDCYNKGRDMYYHVCGMMHIKEPLLLIGESGPCGGSGFSLSLWAHTPVIIWTVCLGQYVSTVVSSNPLRGYWERRGCSGLTHVHLVFKNLLGVEPGTEMT